MDETSASNYFYPTWSSAANDYDGELNSTSEHLRVTIRKEKRKEKKPMSKYIKKLIKRRGWV